MKDVESFKFLVQFANSNFVALPFTCSTLVCLKNLLSISMSKVLLICLNTSLLADFFRTNFLNNFLDQLGRLQIT